jgi:uncharacterized membrane protein affecting hemolysin expression
MKLILFLFILGLLLGYREDRKVKKQQKEWRNAKKKPESNEQERPPK